MSTIEDRSPLGYPEAAAGKGLKTGALGLVSSIVVGVASTAPAYSLAAALGLVVASSGSLVAGVHAPFIMLLAFVPMYFISVAYQELNRAEPDCGTSFTWGARAFGPRSGWMTGWGIIVADVIVMANLAQIAGAYSFTFANLIGIHNTLDQSTFWSTVAGVIWIIVMTYICYRGIEISARIQVALLAIEVIALVMFAVVALVRVYTGHGATYTGAHHQVEHLSIHPAWSWFLPSGMGAFAIASALLSAVFIYWGWDSAVSVNEETENPETTPGRAAVISTLLLLVTYAVVSVAAIAFAGVGTQGIGLGNDNNSGDVFSAIAPVLFGDSLLGHAARILLAFLILSSASASTQTTILPTARTSLSMASYKALPSAFARIHKKYLTPTVSTIAMGGVSIVFYLIFTLISESLLTALISSIGLMIAFYYGLTGFACAWFYRHNLRSSFRNLVMQGIFPVLGGLILAAAFIFAVQQFLQPDYTVDANGNNVTIFGLGAAGVVGIVGLLLGFPLMFVWERIRPDFFRQHTLPKRASDELVLITDAMDPAGDVALRLPDSGLPDILIADDLSNLPPGARAVRRMDLDKRNEE
ncbi:APC family permease [Rudaeicoccus suwonensis]|uniref:Amino acid/polyamine/organocation transporter (APC superfamily) n=1 Tax=Rudaeicoccus suwonensis TaxID=657409 RepID=A0A561E0Z3_9MICO|nr:APC family permease [Rudaeicoccus suwonensis]TWE09273.1 amino acid/polyamine/organocation transporter (APC superfamily) [Rudaeicoccus suwonensis]